MCKLYEYTGEHTCAYTCVNDSFIHRLLPAQWLQGSMHLGFILTPSYWHRNLFNIIFFLWNFYGLYGWREGDGFLKRGAFLYEKKPCNIYSYPFLLGGNKKRYVPVILLLLQLIVGIVHLIVGIKGFFQKRNYFNKFNLNIINTRMF